MTHTRTIPYPYHGATHVPGLVSHHGHGSKRRRSGSQPHPAPLLFWRLTSGARQCSQWIHQNSQRCRAEKRSQRSRCANFRSFMVFPPWDTGKWKTHYSKWCCWQALSQKSKLTMWTRHGRILLFCSLLLVWTAKHNGTQVLCLQLDIMGLPLMAAQSAIQAVKLTLTFVPCELGHRPIRAHWHQPRCCIRPTRSAPATM